MAGDTERLDQPRGVTHGGKTFHGPGEKVRDQPVAQ